MPYQPRPASGPAIIAVGPPERRLSLHYMPEQHIRRGGVGGWVEQPHARQPSTTEWQGRPLHTMSLEVFFDVVRRPGLGRDVEGELAVLHSFGLPVDPADPLSEPPVLRLNFGVGQQLRWVANEIDGITEERDRSGRRVQALVRVDLLEYRAATVGFTALEQAATVAATVADPVARPGGAGRTYTVRAGDDLVSIAARELGDPSRWREICTLNELPDCDLITVGQVLRLPAA